MAEQKIKIIAENRKARHDFTIYETFEAGIALTGTEVKSLRAGKANMKDSYAQVTRQAEVFVYNLHISPTTMATSLTMIRCAAAAFCCTVWRLTSSSAR